MIDRKEYRAVMAAAALAASLLIAQPVTAADRYELRAYLAGPGGEEVAARNYRAALTATSRLRPSAGVTLGLIAATNRCVAHTVMGELAEARVACDAAVVLARRTDTADLRTFASASNTAQALSNRGVLRALDGNVRGATRDFEAAARLRGAPAAPSRNLVRLRSQATDRLVAGRGVE